MAMRCHVDPCTFVMYMHITRDELSEDFVRQLTATQWQQGDSARQLLAQLPPRKQQVHFHEAYHFWQGLRLPFLFRYAFISFRQAFMAFKELSQSSPRYVTWACLLPELERLGLDEYVAWSRPGKLYAYVSADMRPDEAEEELCISPLDLLECATSLAEFQVSAHGDLCDPLELERWSKRNPSYLAPYEFACRFLENPKLAIRAILPMINAAFHTSEPVRAFTELLARTWGRLARGGDMAMQFLAQPEPCRWTDLFRDWLGELAYEAEPDADSKLLGSPYHKVTLDNWVFGSLQSKAGGSLAHPFLSMQARAWIEMQKKFPVLGVIMDQPGWVNRDDLNACRSYFSPAFTVYRFHLGEGRDRVLWEGRAEWKGFTTLPLETDSEWRGFVADMLTMYGAVRRASGSHFNESQRTCHHHNCPHYEANFCNTYPIIPKEFHACGFPERMQRLVDTIRGH